MLRLSSETTTKRLNMPPAIKTVPEEFHHSNLIPIHSRFRNLYIGFSIFTAIVITLIAVVLLRVNTIYIETLKIHDDFGIYIQESKQSTKDIETVINISSSLPV